MSAQAHATLSASGAHRWMACPASVSMEAGLPDKGSPYAAEGTAAHGLAEQCLHKGSNADAHLGEIFSVPVGDEIMEFTVDEEMAEAVQQYLDYVRDQTGKLLIEQRVDYGEWVPGGFGTADAVVLHDGTATVVDLKYGRGVRVDAENNPQAMIYALGSLHDYDFLFECTNYKLVIVQPRLDHISEWEISADDLLEWAENELRPAANAALNNAGYFNPGEKQCRFCKSAATCTALAEHNLKLATEEFNGFDQPLELKDAAKLSNDEIAALLPSVNMLVNWTKAIEAHALDQLDRGFDVPGYKLVEGRSIRKWSDEEAAGKALARKLTTKVAYTRKLITITQAEKRLGKGHQLIDKYTTKPPGKPALATVSDKRPALNVNPGADFDDIAEAA